MQRIFDILLSLLALIVLSPLLLVITILLKFTGEGEVLYSQSRVGKNSIIFKVHKFATMLKNSETMTNGTVTVKNDPRILPIGKLLRKTKINELPQLFNILKGQMSIIGPRPQTKNYFDTISHDKKETILSIRPGLSGIGSIIFRNEEDILNWENGEVFHNTVLTPYKVELEEWYIENNSIFNYFCMIFVTMIIVIFPGSNFYWRIFENLPKPPKELENIPGFKIE